VQTLCHHSCNLWCCHHCCQWQAITNPLPSHHNQVSAVRAIIPTIRIPLKQKFMGKNARGKQSEGP
jgi:hypothetical protein